MIPQINFNKNNYNWRGLVYNGKLHCQEIKGKHKYENNCTKYEGTSLNGIPKDVNLTVTIKSYKDQCQENTIKHSMWDIFTPPTLRMPLKIGIVHK